MTYTIILALMSSILGPQRCVVSVSNTVQAEEVANMSLPDNRRSHDLLFVKGAAVKRREVACLPALRRNIYI